MPDLPARFTELILAFGPLFVHRSWRHAQVPLIGAILTPGRRTVTSVLRIMGRAQERRLVNVHRLLSRASVHGNHMHPRAPMLTVEEWEAQTAYLRTSLPTN